MINVATELRRNTLRADIIDRVRTVLDAARASMVMVVYLEITAAPASADLPVCGKLEIDPVASYGLQIADGLMPRACDPIVCERQLSSACTELDAVLRARAIRTAILVGMETHDAVLNIARTMRAMHRRPVVIDDCVDSWNVGLHTQALLLIRNTLGYVVSSSSLSD